MSPKNQPPKISKKKFTLILILVVAAAILGLRGYLESSRSLNQGVGARAKGNPKAAIQIIEYIDFECPACAVGAKQLKEYFIQYPDKIYLEMRYFPLSNMHRHAVQAARYAQCSARQGKFWPLHDLLIERQNEWKGLTNADPAFMQMAKEVQLDMKSLEVCLQDENIVKMIFEEKDKGSSLGIQSTPTYFVNGEMIVGVKSLTDKLLPLLQNEKK